jgi:hypothetical protein
VRIRPRIAIVAALALAACGDDAGNGDLTPAAPRTPDVTVTSRTPDGEPSANAATPPSADEVEVQGIVGVVDEANRSIAINRLQGADVETVEIGSFTRINDARGGRLRLADIRPSDRIIARGTVDGAALLASEIVVSQVSPGGGAPGG